MAEPQNQVVPRNRPLLNDNDFVPEADYDKIMAPPQDQEPNQFEEEFDRMNQQQMRQQQITSQAYFRRYCLSLDTRVLNDFNNLQYMQQALMDVNLQMPPLDIRPVFQNEIEYENFLKPLLFQKKLAESQDNWLNAEKIDKAHLSAEEPKPQDLFFLDLYWNAVL